MRTVRHAYAAAIFLLTLGSYTAELRAEDCTTLDEGDLGLPLVEHSCFHTTNGPFATVVATPGAVATLATANVDPVHTHYTVGLNAGVSNVVTYRPIRAGIWAVFGDKSPTLHIVNQLGQELPIVRVQQNIACAGLGRAQLYALTAFERYTIVFEPSTATSTILVMEKVSDFRTIYGLDEDGDGVGHDHDVVTTACAPPANYRPSINDCDDGNAQIFPGAIESAMVSTTTVMAMRMKACALSRVAAAKPVAQTRPPTWSVCYFFGYWVARLEVVGGRALELWLAG